MAAAALFMAVFPALADETEGIFRYRILDDGTAMLTGCTSYEETVIIPDTLGGRPVTQIGNEVFSRRMSLRAVTIPDRVVSIGNSAFSGCTELREMKLPSKLNSIGC